MKILLTLFIVFNTTVSLADFSWSFCSDASGIVHLEGDELSVAQGAVLVNQSYVLQSFMPVTEDLRYCTLGRAETTFEYFRNVVTIENVTYTVSGSDDSPINVLVMCERGHQLTPEDDYCIDLP